NGIENDRPKEREWDLRADHDHPRKPEPLLPKEKENHPINNQRPAQSHSGGRQRPEEGEANAEKESTAKNHRKLADRRDAAQPIVPEQVQKNGRMDLDTGHKRFRSIRTAKFVLSFPGVVREKMRPDKNGFVSKEAALYHLGIQ